MALNGSLDDYSPAGALRVLSSTGKTGAVRFNGRAGCTAYLNDGQLYFARGAGTDDALANALVRPGRVTAEAWGRAVEEAGDSPRVAELLLAHSAIDPDLLASVVLSIVYDPLITLFREGDGQFDFEPDTMHWIGPYRGFNVEAIVNEVRRRVRNADELSDIVPSTTAWVSPVRALPDGAAQVTLLREDWELVTSLAGPRTIDDLALSLGRGRYSTAQIAGRLARAGLLEVFPDETAPADPLAGVDEAIEQALAADLQAAPPAEDLTGSEPDDPQGFDEVTGFDDQTEPHGAVEPIDAAETPAPAAFPSFDGHGSTEALNGSQEPADHDPIPFDGRPLSDLDLSGLASLPPGPAEPVNPLSEILGLGSESSNDDEQPIDFAATFDLAPEPIDGADSGFGPRNDAAPVPEPVADAGDDAWSAWATESSWDSGFDSPVQMGPRADLFAGPEPAPDDALLPRRTSVQEAPPEVEEDLSRGLAGITGFHDPTASAVQRSEQAMSAAAQPEPVLDANAAWLENLYVQFIDEAVDTGGGRNRRQALDVAFQTPEQGDNEKVGTLKRLAAALRRL